MQHWPSKSLVSTGFFPHHPEGIFTDHHKRITSLSANTLTVPIHIPPAEATLRDGLLLVNVTAVTLEDI